MYCNDAISTFGGTLDSFGLDKDMDRVWGVWGADGKWNRRKLHSDALER